MPYMDGTEFTDEDEASAQGEEDGHEEAFYVSPARVLCYGQDCWNSY